MAKLLYCWRRQMEIPMLDATEATYVLEPLKSDNHVKDMESAKKLILQRRTGSEWTDGYFEITGFKETNANAIFQGPSRSAIRC